MRYAFGRLTHAAVLLVLVSMLSFLLLELAPGDYTDAMRLDPRISAATAAAWRSRYGLDRPVAIKYWMWMRSVLRGEFGFSFAYGMPVGTLIWPRIKNTLALATLALAISWSAALLIGAVAAACRSSTLTNFIRGGIAFLHSIPDLLIALAVLMWTVRKGWFPGGGTAFASAAGATDLGANLAPPVLALVLASLPVLLRHVQAAMREAMGAPFVQAARAHGIPRRRLWIAYMLPAAANPLISLFGYSLGALLSSSLLIEVIMGWPGLGPLLLEAIFGRDLYVVIGATLLSASFLITGNLIADLLLYAADPRIRRENS